MDVSELKCKSTCEFSFLKPDFYCHLARAFEDVRPGFISESDLWWGNPVTFVVQGKVLWQINVYVCAGTSVFKLNKYLTAFCPAPGKVTQEIL